MAARLEISAAGCCVCQRPVSCSRPLQTHCHPSDGLSAFLFWLALTLPFSVATSLFTHYSLSPSSPPSSPRSVSSQRSTVTLANQTESSGLVRLLGVAFPGEKDKQEWEREQEEARRRDHRRIGTVWQNLNKEMVKYFLIIYALWTCPVNVFAQDQDLFFFNDVSPGSCFFLPKGAHIYNTLTDFIKVNMHSQTLTTSCNSRW